VTLTIERFAYTPQGTFSKLTFPVGDFWCYTVERPWVNNTPNESCIPEGDYTIERSVYHRGNYDCYEVLDVPGRTLIKMHIANTMLDVLGCIGLGLALGFVNNLWAVTNSRLAFEKFMEEMGGKGTAQLSITHFELGRYRVG
jgi:hypothetical protein